jgi:2-dehydropantoate 2-reductase
MARECIAVGRAEGAVLEDGLAATILEACRKAPPDSVNSLHADRAAGRPMEIDARNGAIVRFGRQHGIPTPCNEMAAIVLTAMQGAGGESSPGDGNGRVRRGRGE